MQDAGPTQHTRNTSKRIGSRVHQRANQGTDSEHDRDVNPAGAKNKRFTDPALGGLLPQNPKKKGLDGVYGHVARVAARAVDEF